MGMHSGRLTVVHADVRDFLRSAPTAHFDGVIADAPYGLGITSNLRSGSHWDDSRIAFDASFWAAMRRTVKPGGNLAAFGHSRTGHRQTVAIEDGEWRLVDTVAFVKSHGYIPGDRGLEKAFRKDGLDALSREYTGYSSHLKPAYEPITLARNLSGRDSLVDAIANGGAGGFNTGALKIPAANEDLSRMPGRVNTTAAWSVSRPAVRSTAHDDGRHPTNLLFEHAAACSASQCSEDCGLSWIDMQARKKYANGRERPSRFFSSLRYSARAPQSERPVVDGVGGPTVKSQALLDWLCTLVGVRPGTTWLDPFGGSGAVAEGIVRAGGHVVTVEREAIYIELIRERFCRLETDGTL